MSDARADIMAKVRRALGRENLSATERQALDQRMNSPPTPIQPEFTDDPLQRFEQQLQAVNGTFDQVSASGLFTAIANHLRTNGLPQKLVAAPALRDLAWPDSLDATFGSTDGDDLVAVTPCFAAVAETGSVVLLSSAESPTRLNYLPDYHIVIVKAEQLVRHIEDVWSRLRACEIPRAVNFITGPSKTADVEQTLQYGAHGPRSLHVIFLTG